MKKGEKLLFLAGILLAIGALAFSAWKLRGIYGEYQEGEDTYEELASFVEEPEDTPKPDGSEPMQNRTDICRLTLKDCRL